MKILIDTNVILDILLKRESFFADSYKALRTAAEKNMDCLVSATAATDIYYLLRKGLRSDAIARQYMHCLSQLVLFADVLSEDVLTATESEISDFEDAVVIAVAKRIGADYILTRNVKDFTDSNPPAITPSEFVKIFR